VIRKAGAVDLGGGGRPVEEGRLLLAEECGGRVRSVEVVRMVSGNSIPETVLGFCCQFVSPLL